MPQRAQGLLPQQIQLPNAHGGAAAPLAPQASGTVPHPDTSSYGATSTAQQVLADAGDLLRAAAGGADIGKVPVGGYKNLEGGLVNPAAGWTTGWNPDEPGQVRWGVAEPFGELPQLTKAKAKLEAITPREEFQTRYPKVGPPGAAVTDPKTGKTFFPKQLTPEAEAVAKVRTAAQANIDAGNYKPYFDVEKRFHVDPANYPLAQKTSEVARPARAATEDVHRARINPPEAEKRLGAGWDASKDDPLAHDWYAMGQFEQKGRERFGDEAGRAMYKKNFADAMAATTTGQAPKENLAMAGYGNFMRTSGQPFPTESHQLPYPIGGDKAGTNIRNYEKLITNGAGLSPVEQPKGHNFSGNFQGHQDINTVDTQMMGAIDPTNTKGAPPKGTYGIHEDVVANAAAKTPGAKNQANYQGVTWTGLKKLKAKPGKVVTGKPMIQEANETIERIHQVTGMDRDSIFDGIFKGTIPIFGAAGAAYLAGKKPE